MLNKIFSNLFMLSFFLIIFSVPVFWVLRGENPQTKSLVEARNLVNFSFSDRGFQTAFRNFYKGDYSKAKTVLTGQFLNRAFQQDLEKAASDQFPFRYLAIKASKALDRQVIELAYSILPDPAIPVDMKPDSALYVLRDKSAIIYEPDRFTTALQETIDRRITNYTDLIRAFPTIHFYAYCVDRLQSLPVHPLNQYFSDADGGRVLEYFVQHQPEALVFGHSDYRSYDEAMDMFYRTDHHWNIHGILRAYVKIYEMLALNYPEISQPVQVDQLITFPEIEFLGSLARRSFYPIQGEAFEVATYTLLPYKVYENGQEITYGNSGQYLVGNFSLEPYVNHYGEYYGNDKALLEFVSEYQTGRKLLVIGDSFDNPLLPILASHYQSTYSVDLGHYVNFSLAAFLSMYRVDDILIVGSSDIVYGSDQWTISP